MMLVEFGRVVALSSPGDDQEERVRSNYARVKARHFPDWPGEPDIHLAVPCECGWVGCVIHASGWRADVPEEFVL